LIRCLHVVGVVEKSSETVARFPRAAAVLVHGSTKPAKRENRQCVCCKRMEKQTEKKRTKKEIHSKNSKQAQEAAERKTTRTQNNTSVRLAH